MNNIYTKSKVISSLLWKLMERGGTQGIQVVVQILLQRFLLPDDFAPVVMVTIFIVLANVFVQNGFNTALIQKKNADEIDFSSVFYLSMFVAGLLYVILFFTAPFIAVYFRMPQLVLVLRVLSITLFLGALKSIQYAFISRNMMFKKLFLSSLAGIIISGVVGIVTAYIGWGVWALVAHQITNQLSIMIILWFTVKWRPKLLFSFVRLKDLFSYGWKMLASSLLYTLYMDIRSLIIGRMYTPDMLSFYDRGQQYPKVIATNIDGSVQSVMLPALASHQDDKKRVKNMVRRSIVTSSFIMFPMMIGLAVVTQAVVKILIGDQWLPMVPFMQIFCISNALRPIHTANIQAINALGRSDIFLKLEVIKRIIGLTILGISIPFGVYAMAWGVLLSGVISTFVNVYPNIKLLNYSYIEQIKDIIPSLLLSLFMGGAVYSLNFLSLSPWQVLILQIMVGVSLYFGLAKVLKLECFNYLIKTVMELIKSKKRVTV